MFHMNYLLENQNHYQNVIESILEKYEVLPVGNRFIDLILPREMTNDFIQELTNISIGVQYITWWCYCTPYSQKTYGCPHGLGGPGFGEGYYSECNGGEVDVAELVKTSFPSTEPKGFAIECNRWVLDYFVKRFKTESFYSPCLNPGFWLLVPETWKREQYWVSKK